MKFPFNQAGTISQIMITPSFPFLGENQNQFFTQDAANVTVKIDF